MALLLLEFQIMVSQSQNYNKTWLITLNHNRKIMPTRSLLLKNSKSHYKLLGVFNFSAVKTGNTVMCEFVYSLVLATLRHNFSLVLATLRHLPIVGPNKLDLNTIGRQNIIFKAFIF